MKAAPAGSPGGQRGLEPVHSVPPFHRPPSQSTVRGRSAGVSQEQRTPATCRRPGEPRGLGTAGTQVPALQSLMVKIKIAHRPGPHKSQSYLVPEMIQ